MLVDLPDAAADVLIRMIPILLFMRRSQWTNWGPNDLHQSISPKCFCCYFEYLTNVFFFFHLSLLQLKPTLSMKAARCITMTGAKWDSMQYHYLCTTKITHELVCFPTQHKYGANDWRDLTINYKWAGLNSRLQELLASYHYHSLASRLAIKS